MLGIVLHTGAELFELDDRIIAVPICAFWGAGAPRRRRPPRAGRRRKDPSAVAPGSRQGTRRGRTRDAAVGARHERPTLTAFADSSALVKLYADEEHAGRVRRRPLLVVSALARVEVASALWRKQRLGELSAESTSVLVAAWDADWHELDGRFAVVPARADVLELAAMLSGRYALRAYDAVQLASATAARAVEPSIEEFLCFDVELRHAAAREGFALAS